ncbi:MAG: DivIVA domain-containing protein, partial [Ruminococcaceae bacterium]|nr:DivIVA domain-containing protein [Oscillospiraceae bacterium]
MNVVKICIGGFYMSEAKNVVFRSAVSGYNKTDVNEYLLRIVGEFNEKEEALKKKTEYAEKETSALKEKLDEMENLLDEQKSVLNQKNSELDRVTLEKE